MAGETLVTVIGNLTADPELRFTPSGDPVANFTIASTPRTFDKQSNEWKDGETLFMRSSLWREAAENAAETFTKGMRVIAQGTLKPRSYEKDGAKVNVIELEVQEIGPSIKSATAKVTKTQRNQQGQGGQYGNQQAPQQGQGGFPGQQGQAPQQGGFPGQQGGFPQGPPMQGGFPQQGGYPQAPQQGGYPQPGGYPQQ